ncbi:hypothetical protein OBBRIDRAFT_791905 [Obba rivulosa]|uniref:DRBM domain-containing protein n=1 Tax=Obba rivulosa TaxID=1052685 RepID=A0A8E2DLQ0_9APHY|nr:hypothetical protein OBBRIDRAFT_791905 [Obba rivulosa]
MSTNNHPRMQLNNILQTYGHRPEWHVHISGSQHNPVWHATVYIRGVQSGVVQGPNRGAAMDRAAHEALRSFR